MDKQMKGSSLKKIGALLPWLWLAAGYVLDIWFQLVPGKWIVDSDLASEMMLTKILNQEGSILSHSWYYSTELRVVNMQWFYRLGLLLFPDDWHLARTFGMAIALLVFIAAALLLAKEIGLGSLGPWMVGALIWPFGMRYLVYAMYGWLLSDPHAFAYADVGAGLLQYPCCKTEGLKCCVLYWLVWRLWGQA